MIKIFICFILINTLFFAFADDTTAPSEETHTEENASQDSSSADADDESSKIYEKTLHNLEININGEDDRIHEQTVENAGDIIIETENMDFAWRAMYIMEQGLNKSEDVQEETVFMLGKVIREVQDSELRDKAFSLLEGHLPFASEDVFIEIVKAAERIVKAENSSDNAEEVEEDNETTDTERALSLITKGMHEESDDIQKQTLKSLAKIIKANPQSETALEALTVIENGKSIQSESVIETLIYYVPGRLAFVDNPEIVDRVLSLLEWGMLQNENIKFYVIRRAGRIFESAEGEPRDRVFAILQQGFTFQQNEAVQKTLVSTLEDTENEESRKMLLDLLNQEQVQLNEN